jgi:hypothetical protein
VRVCCTIEFHGSDQILPSGLLKLTNPYLPIWEHRSDFEMAAKRLDILNQRADANVAAALNPRHLALVNTKDFTELELRHLSRLSESVERHRRKALLEPFCDRLLSGGRHRLDQLLKFSSRH